MSPRVVWTHVDFAGVSVNMLEEEKWSIFAPSPSAMKEARSIIDELLEDKPVRNQNDYTDFLFLRYYY